jgi:conjugal transfer mating pair stabilization protein TraG
MTAALQFERSLGQHRFSEKSPMTVNVITSGGGQYIVNVLNAVAAWTGGGGFRSMLQVVMVMGLGYSLLVMAFSLNWRVLFHWFLSATAMYMCMIVPTTTVVVSDTINPTVGNGAVANVPIGLAMVASFSSQVNNWLTKTAESVFTMPSALTYSAGGMIPRASTISPASSRLPIRS